MHVLKEKAIEDLAALVGKESVHTDEAALKGGEGLNRTFAKAFGVYTNPLPIAVVDVHNTE